MCSLCAPCCLCQFVGPSPHGVFQAFVPGVPLCPSPALYSAFCFWSLYLFIYFFLHFLDFGSYVLWISALVFRICPPVSCVSVHPDKSVFDISFLSVNRKCHTKLLLHPFLANLDICYRNGLALCHSFHWRQYLSKHQFDDCKF